MISLIPMKKKKKKIPLTHENQNSSKGSSGLKKMCLIECVYVCVPVCVRGFRFNMYCSILFNVCVKTFVFFAHMSAEQNKNTERECTPSQFKCATGNKCIEEIYRCDGHPDCPDRSDEDCLPSANDTTTHITSPTSTLYFSVCPSLNHDRFVQLPSKMFY